MTEGGSAATVYIRIASERERESQLVEVLLIGEPRVLVEPFRRHELGGRARGFASVVEADARAHEGLRRGGERHDAEAKWQPEAHLALEEVYFAHRKPHSSASMMPRT